MRKIIRINTETGLFIEDVILQNGEATPDDCIETPCPDGFYHPKWDGEIWVEGKDLSVLEAEQLLQSLTPSIDDVGKAEREIETINLLIELGVLV